VRSGHPFPCCLDAGNLFFRKACGGGRGGPGWGDADVSVKRCELESMIKINTASGDDQRERKNTGQ